MDRIQDQSQTDQKKTACENKGEVTKQGQDPGPKSNRPEEDSL